MRRGFPCCRGFLSSQCGWQRPGDVEVSTSRLQPGTRRRRLRPRLQPGFLRQPGDVEGSTQSSSTRHPGTKSSLSSQPGFRAGRGRGRRWGKTKSARAVGTTNQCAWASSPFPAAPRPDSRPLRIGRPRHAKRVGVVFLVKGVVALGRAPRRARAAAGAMDARARLGAWCAV